MDGAKRVGAYLTGEVLSHLGLASQMNAGLLSAWRECVSPSLVRHALPMRYRAGVLTLHVTAAAWASRLRHQQAALITQLHLHPVFRELTSLRLRVAPLAQLPQRRRKSTARTKTASLSGRTSALLRGTAEEIKDPDLQAALRRLAENV